MVCQKRPWRDWAVEWRNRFYYWVDSLAARAAGATVCYVTEDLRSRYGKAHAELRTFVIPNGVPPMERDRYVCPPDMREQGFRLLVAGRLDLVKGHHLAVHAIANEALRRDVHLYFLGEGPRASQLRSLASSVGVSDRVHMLGFRRNPYDYIAHCDVLLMPSLHEGLPYTLLEAMALGVPVIASRVGGLSEVIEDGVTGLLVEPQCADALARAIQRLRENGTLRSSIAEEAKKVQRSQYSLEKMAQRYTQIYRDL